MFILKFCILNDAQYGIDYWEFKFKESLMSFIEERIEDMGDEFEIIAIYEVADEYKLVSKGFSLEKVCVGKEKYSTNFAPCPCGKERENPKESVYCDICYNVDYHKRLYAKRY